MKFDRKPNKLSGTPVSELDKSSKSLLMAGILYIAFGGIALILGEFFIPGLETAGFFTIFAGLMLVLFAGVDVRLVRIEKMMGDPNEN